MKLIPLNGTEMENKEIRLIKNELKIFNKISGEFVTRALASFE